MDQRDGTFTGYPGANGRSYTMKGSLDGGSTLAHSVCATVPGTWNYTTTSTDPGLNARRAASFALRLQRSKVDANELLGGFHPARRLRMETLQWQTVPAPRSDTQWSFSEEFYLDELKTVDGRTERPEFQRDARVHLAGKYTRNGCRRSKTAIPKTDVLQPAYFQQLDQLVAHANQRGVMMGLGQALRVYQC